MIHEAMLIYPVSAKQAEGDYHGNVDAETYMRWFRTLLNALIDKGPHIIVSKEQNNLQGKNRTVYKFGVFINIT
jgi:hypothetical protein